jgi:uncharacterized protein
MLEQLVAVAPPAELFRGLAHRRLGRRGGEQIADCGGEGFGVAPDEAAGFGTVDRVAGAADGAGDQKRAAGERHDPHVCEAVCGGGVDGDVGGGEQSGERFVGLLAEEPHPRRHAEAPGEPLQRGSVGTIADDEQGRVRQARQRLDGDALALARDQPAGGDEERARHAEHGPGGGAVDGGIYRALLLTPESASEWEAPALADLDVAHLAPVLALDPPPEFLILGTGPAMAFAPRRLVEALETRGIGIETMDSRAAARTWGLLRAEERWIAAAIMPL